jgi:hypothetical protein
MIPSIKRENMPKFEKEEYDVRIAKVLQSMA